MRIMKIFDVGRVLDHNNPPYTGRGRGRFNIGRVLVINNPLDAPQYPLRRA